MITAVVGGQKIPIDKEGWKLGPSKSEVLREHVVYGPTYLTADDGKVTLFLRRYRLLRLPSGKLVIRWAPGVKQYDNSDQMVAGIEEQELTEMPAETPDSAWVPVPIQAAIPQEG